MVAKIPANCFYEFTNVNWDWLWRENVYQHCVYVASDVGRVCRPLVIADKGISRVKQHHMKELQVHVLYFLESCILVLVVWVKYIGWLISIFLKDGVRTFDDFIRDGLIEYLDVNEENNALVCLSLHIF